MRPRNGKHSQAPNSLAKRGQPIVGAEAGRCRSLHAGGLCIQCPNLARDTGLADGHARALQGVSLPDGVTRISRGGASPRYRLRERRESEARRGKEIAVIRKRLREVEAAAQATRHRTWPGDACRGRFDIASEAARHAAENLAGGSAVFPCRVGGSMDRPRRRCSVRGRCCPG